MTAHPNSTRLAQWRCFAEELHKCTSDYQRVAVLFDYRLSLSLPAQLIEAALGGDVYPPYDQF